VASADGRGLPLACTRGHGGAGRLNSLESTGVGRSTLSYE